MITKSIDARTPPPAEAWLCGSLPDVSPLLMPAAHALIQAARDIELAAANLSAEELWTEPGGAPSVGFHLRHVAGSIDRLLTYARGEGLGEKQFQELAAEGSSGEGVDDAATLVRKVKVRIESAIQVPRTTADESFAEPRAVGRAKLPSTVFGLLFHIAEHTQRHTGQIVTTARVVRGTGEIVSGGD